MPSLGSKRKDNPSRMDNCTEDMPQLSNQMQLDILNKVKSGELSIDDALKQARMDREQLTKQQNVDDKELEPQSQYNFSVHKHSHYRWHKRVFQIDFRTKLLCSIEKGIVKQQLPFSIVKSCDDGVGSRFSISFKGHHDYELEATSLEDKHKMMELVSKIIYSNIYDDPEQENAESHEQPQASQSIRKGMLLLHRGGLASFRWVKYEAHLHLGQLTLVPLKGWDTTDGEMTSSVPVSTVIHLSDGDTSVQKFSGCDTFSLITYKNEYQFKVADETSAPETVQRERDSWVKAIEKLCSEWKRKTKFEQKSFPIASAPEDTEDNDTDLESSGEFGAGSTTYPPADSKNAGPPLRGANNLSDQQTHPPADPTKPIPKPRRKNSAKILKSQLPSPPSPFCVGPTSSSFPTLPSHAVLTPPFTVSESPTHESESLVVKGPSAPRIPPPPPLPFKLEPNAIKANTKAFHWDPIGSDKIAKSFWIQEGTGRVEIDTSLLHEQFAVKDSGAFGAVEPNNMQHIMLNQKIAHNFNIFLKSFPVQPGELKDKLFIINEKDGGLSDEHITSLRRYVPTMEDVEMYKSFKGPVTELHVVDQYMIEICDIPYLSTQLDLLLTLRELPISMNDLQPLINQKIRMCTQLYNCRSFVSVLEYLLAIGNYLNENAGKEKAKGFRLSSLTQLTQFRGKDKKFTLLHALVEQIMLHEPCLATFTQELAEFETVPGASIKGLTAEVDVLKNELKKLIQYRKTFKKKNTAAQYPNFSKDLKMAIEKYDAALSALTKTCEEMKKLYSGILVKFGELADQDSQELFGLICRFVHDFKRAHAETV